jgi:hypothetical protein
MQKFRIYGINATGSAGNLRIDDVTFTACPVVTIDSIVPNPTNGGTTVTWTATGITWNIVNSGGDTNFTLSATAITGAGTLIPTIPAGAVTDLVGNGNTASTSTDNSVTFNIVSPTGVVISEFRTRGPDGAEDEYIELYNPTSTVVDISGWKINVSNDTGSTSTRATIPASTILRSGQYYLIAKSGTDGYSGIVPANLTYGQGITNAGGIALVRPDNTIVDEVGMGAGSAYKEGTPLSPLPSNSDQSYERKLGRDSQGNDFDSCQDTDDNANDFSIKSSDPKNYASQLSLCGTLRTIPAPTTTTITADTPDPSLVNANVSVSVKVSGGSIIPPVR